MIYENITALCKENGISVSALEKALGFGNATIRGWANSDPGAAKLKKVADHFGVTVDSLFTDNTEIESS